MSNDIEQSPQEPQPNFIALDTLPPKQKSKRTWIAFGCGCLGWSFMAFMGFSFVVTFILPLLSLNLWVSDGEHLPTAEFAPGSTNYSFSETYMRRWREFDIPEAAFLEVCK
jgi:hypothetical protein